MVINFIKEVDSSSHFPFQLSKTTFSCEPKACFSVGFVKSVGGYWGGAAKPSLIHVTLSRYSEDQIHLREEHNTWLA